MTARSARRSGIVLYDYLLARGGAERVTLTLANQLPAALGVGFIERQLFPAQQLADIPLHNLDAKTRITPWRYVKVARAFVYKTEFLKNYDWVLYSGSCAPVAVCNHPAGPNLYYCHALPSFAYELSEYYLDRTPAPLRPALRGLAQWVRGYYEPALHAMDAVIANSTAVQQLLKHYLNIDSCVVYPPVDTQQFRWQSRGDYYLSTARLEPHKRVQIIVDAFRRMPDKKLIVAGWGSQGEVLRRHAADATNIQFTGWVDASHMQQLLGHCIASIYLGMQEPFGISPVESMAAGKPVIGVAEGGLLDTRIIR
jgi:glycosyltransferase involved in cell wall biosynthesis